MKKVTTTTAKTMAVGKAIAARLRGGEIIALSGDLGAGKTTLVKGIAAGLGIKKTITSPTFLLMRTYPLPRNKRGIGIFVHIDCYRLRDYRDLLAIGAEQYFGRPDCVVAIEWPEKIKRILPRQARRINLELLSETKRNITLGA